MMTMLVALHIPGAGRVVFPVVGRSAVLGAVCLAPGMCTLQVGPRSGSATCHPQDRMSLQH
ncbi:hypothetical protein E2C01_012276 [Portunus trituberculatus]|uniref:Uncharacterized protein n=1 Tax=Portunus trituberculatus TaxID=210409 RepID=A0A5B7DDL3_PORTR|nr:hypothetical protein [Portunus trituberculatus]